MKPSIFTLILFLSQLTFAQLITIEQGPHAYFDIFEWKGMGGILMSKDPSGNSKQINLTLVGKEQKSIWDQKFTPRNEDFYFISSENARYVYFLHNLNPEAGKIYFAQLNEAGNVKATSVSLSSAIKKLGDFDLENLELRNVIVTDKALVHQFRYHNKKEKSYTEIATFMTHHNMLVYATLLGNIPEDAIKSDKSSHWRYIGFDGDKICFSSKQNESKSNDWNVSIFTSKAELIEEKRIKSPVQKFSSIENIGFGTTGSFYLKNNNDVQNALLTFHNNRFYLSGLKNEGNQTTLQIYELSTEKWLLINQLPLEKEDEKRIIQLGIYPLNEGLGYHYKGNSGDKTAFLPFDKSSPLINPFTEKTVFNPSRVIIEDEKTQFAVTLPTGNLFFDLLQLKKQGNVKFEFKQTK